MGTNVHDLKGDSEEGKRPFLDLKKFENKTPSLGILSSFV